MDEFDRLCSELQRNPVAATTTIEKLRESDAAVTLCQQVLLSNFSWSTKFQAMLILQYALMNRWNIIPKHLRVEIRGLLELLIVKFAEDKSVPQFFVNKAFQVFVAVWKRGWLESDPTEKSSLFQQISSLLAAEHTLRIGIVLLRTMIEEFSKRGSFETNVQLEHQLKVKENFQKEGLLTVYALGVRSVGSLFAAIQQTQSSTLLNTFSELLKLLVEIISWDFDASNVGAHGEEPGMKVHSVHKLPAEWAAFLVHSRFASDVFAVYCHLRHIQKQQQGQHGRGGEIDACLQEVRNLLICLCGINGDIFQGQQEKLHHSECIVSELVTLLHGVPLPGAPQQLQIQQLSLEFRDFVYEDVDLLLTMVHRLINNFNIAQISQLPSFERLMMLLGQLSQEIAKEFHIIAAQMHQIIDTHVRNGQEALLRRMQQSYELNLLNTWRGDLLTLCLDFWCSILDDPLVVLGAESNTAAGGNGTAASTSSAAAAAVISSPAFRSWLMSTSHVIYGELFQALFSVYVSDSLLSAEAEENTEDALIESRTVEDLLCSVSTIGRVSAPTVLPVLYKQLSDSLVEATQLTQFLPSISDAQAAKQWKHAVFKCLEKFRMGVMFCSYLLVDNFQENKEMMCRETPNLNAFLLFALHQQENFLTTLHDLVRELCNVLCQQLQLTGSGNYGSGNGDEVVVFGLTRRDMLSPIVIQQLYRFFTEYVVRFMDPDPCAYAAEVWAQTPTLQLLHGEQINTLLEVLLNGALHVCTQLTMEEDVLKCVSEFIVALSSTINTARIQTIVAFPVVRQLVQLLLTYNEACRLNAHSLAFMFEAVCALCIQGKHNSYLNQICSTVYNLLQMNGQAVSKVHLERSLSCLVGIARSPSGEDKAIHTLFDLAWPLLMPLIERFYDSDDILKLYSTLLKTYAEYQLLRLNNQSCYALYHTAYHLLQIYSKRFEFRDRVYSEDEQLLFRSDACFYILDLLNQLSLKDFSFFEDIHDLGISRSFEEEISTVLLFGFRVLLPIITVEMLRNYSNTAEKYYSYVAFMTASYMKHVTAWLHSLEPQSSKMLLFTILNQLLFGSVHMLNAATARSALQSMQAFATHQWNELSKRRGSLEKAIFELHFAEIHTTMLKQLLELILASTAASSSSSGLDSRDTSEKSTTAALSTTAGGGAAGLHWDRMDAFANVLYVYFVLEQNQLLALIEATVRESASNTLSVPRQQLIFECFQQLVTANGVQFRQVDRGNRLRFMKNFREFIVKIKSI